MNRQSVRRIGIAVGVAAVIALLAWGLDREARVQPPDAPVRSSSEAPAAASTVRDAGLRIPPPKPAYAQAEGDPALGPWANEQPPPDFMGDPDDAGMPPHPPEPRLVAEPMSEAELDRRRLESVELIATTLRELDAQIARAEASGRDDVATVLRHRRERLEARRDQLEWLLAP